MNNKNYTEFEAKFYPIDKEEYRRKLKSIGAELIIPERKMVRWVADYRDNPILSKKECIRVRNEGGLVRLSFKSFVNDLSRVSDQKEIETEVGDFAATVKIFEKIGLKFNRNQETFREEWKYKKVQITIDTWPGLLPFLEIEGTSEAEIKQISSELGFVWDEKLIFPSSGLYAKVYGVDEDTALVEISNISFNNPPFKGKKKIWPQKDI